MRTPSSPSASSSASASRAVLRMGRPFVLKDVLMSAAQPERRLTAWRSAWSQGSASRVATWGRAVPSKWAMPGSAAAAAGALNHHCSRR